MGTAYYTGAGRQKLVDQVIRTLFVYLEDNTTVKFQRITGTKGDVAEVFFKGITTQSGAASSLLLAKSGTGDVPVDVEIGGQALPALSR